MRYDHREIIYCEAALEAAEVYGRRIRPPSISVIRRPRRRPVRSRTRQSTSKPGSGSGSVKTLPGTPSAYTPDDTISKINDNDEGGDENDHDDDGLRMSSDYASRRTLENIMIDDRNGEMISSDHNYIEDNVSDLTDDDDTRSCFDQYNDQYVILKRSQSEPHRLTSSSSSSLSPPSAYAVSTSLQSPTLSFPYPSYMNLKRSGSTVPVRDQVRFKIQDQMPDYQVLSRVALHAGLKPTRSTARCNLFWGKTLLPDQWELLTSVQKVNHFPSMQSLSRKDKLAQNLRQHCSDFIPETYILPADRLAFQHAANNVLDAIWIQKPHNSSCGRGIRLIDRFSQIGARSKSVLSRYIDRPYLINHHKFDVRLYFVISCFDPLRIYTLDDGLVRFATQRYSLERATFNEKCVHLTNFAVNRRSKNFVKTGVSGDIGSKWSYKALLAHLTRHHGHEAVETVRQRIHEIAIRSIIAVEHLIIEKMQTYRCPRKACFEVLGFDILLDADLKPWLLEINSQPSLGSPSALDKFIKTKLMADVFHLIGLPAVENNLKMIKRTQTRRLKRVIGLRKSEQAESSMMAKPVLPLTRSSLQDHDIDILRESESEVRFGYVVL